MSFLCKSYYHGRFFNGVKDTFEGNKSSVQAGRTSKHSWTRTQKLFNLIKGMKTNIDQESEQAVELSVKTLCKENVRQRELCNI